MRTLFAVAVAFGLVMAGAARAQSAAEIAEAESEYTEWAKQYGSVIRECVENTIQYLTATKTEFPNLPMANSLELLIFDTQELHQRSLDHSNGYLENDAALFPIDPPPGMSLEELFPSLGMSLEEYVTSRKQAVRKSRGEACTMADTAHNGLEDLRRRARQ